MYDLVAIGLEFDVFLEDTNGPGFMIGGMVPESNSTTGYDFWE